MMLTKPERALLIQMQHPECVQARSKQRTTLHTDRYNKSLCFLSRLVYKRFPVAAPNVNKLPPSSRHMISLTPLPPFRSRPRAQRRTSCKTPITEGWDNIIQFHADPFGIRLVRSYVRPPCVRASSARERPWGRQLPRSQRSWGVWRRPTRERRTGRCSGDGARGCNIGIRRGFHWAYPRADQEPGADDIAARKAFVWRGKGCWAG